MDPLVQQYIAERFATELLESGGAISGPEMENYIDELYPELEDLGIADEYYRELTKYGR
jgi:hypothetical protein